MNRSRAAGISCLAIVCMLAFSGTAFSQVGEKQGGAGQSPMVMGEVTGIDATSLTVKTGNGATERMTITTSTVFVQETAADSSALVVGETVVVIGQPEGQGAIVPRMVRIVDKIDDMSRPRGQGGQAMQGGQPRGGQTAQGGQAEGGATPSQPGGQMMGGLVVGAVVGLNPLKIGQPSGITTIAKLTDTTRITVEKSVDSSKVSKGSRVRVLAPSSRASASRQARKVIILSDSMPAPLQ